MLPRRAVLAGKCWGFKLVDGGGNELRMNEQIDHIAQNGVDRPRRPEPDAGTGNGASQAPSARPTGGHCLSIAGISKTQGKRPILQDINLTVGRGEVVGLLGPNGAGKTTTFYIITGLISPDSGTIHFDGREITKLPMYRRARLGIGYLPQEASIFRGMNVENNIRSVLEVAEPDRQRRDEKLERLLNEFSISHLRHSQAMALSGGERRRCEIARALASDPAIILLDEPFAGIDPIAMSDIRELVAHLKDRGVGVLVTDHNVRETLDIIDRAYIIFDGHVLMEGTPDAILENQDVRRVYLGEEFRV
jgi:lipopolysaccharide export system ATP-binding protein